MRVIIYFHCTSKAHIADYPYSTLFVSSNILDIFFHFTVTCVDFVLLTQIYSFVQRMFMTLAGYLEYLQQKSHGMYMASILYI